MGRVIDSVVRNHSTHSKEVQRSRFQQGATNLAAGLAVVPILLSGCGGEANNPDFELPNPSPSSSAQPSPPSPSETPTPSPTPVKPAPTPDPPPPPLPGLKEPSLDMFGGVKKVHRELSPGINQIWYSAQTSHGSQIGHIVFVDAKDPNLQVRVSAANEQGMTPTQWAQKHGAKLAMNGAFFRWENGGLKALGLNVSQGTPYPGAHDSEGFIAFDINDNALFNGGGPAVQWDKSWTNVMSTHPARLIIDGNRKNVNGDPFFQQAHPRSALCAAPNGELMFLVVEGRNGRSTGATGDELSAIGKQAGCKNMNNLDGGGSSEIATEAGRLNLPNGEIRPVANYIGVFRSK